jgi:hypothetical protein
VTESWENVQFGVAGFACPVGTVVLVDPFDGVGAGVVDVTTRVEVVELAE